MGSRSILKTRMSTPAYLEHYRAAFERFLATRSGDPAWMTALRKSAFAAFEEQRLPSRKHEQWRYLSLRGFAAETFAPAALEEVDVSVSPYEPIARITCNNGHVSLGQSDIGRLGSDVAYRPLSEAWDQAKPTLEKLYAEFSNGFTALVAAFLQDGAVLDIGREVELDEPIEFVRQTTSENAFSSSILIVHARRMSKATVVERLIGTDDLAYFSGGFTVLDAEDGSNLDHVINQRESGSAFRHARTVASVARDATLKTFNASIGSRLSRDDVDAVINGEGAHMEMNALYLGSDSQTLDHWTRVDHAVPRCTSDQLYKTVLDDKSHGVFAGTVVVRRDAQQISAGQLNNNLLLTESARIDTKPQLEIAADDVVCGHGATIGQIDDDERFYLETRGISTTRARQILINGFAAEVVYRVSNPRVRDSLLHDVEGILSARPGSQD